MESSPRDQKYGQRRQGLCVVWDKVKLVLAVFCIALCCRLRSDCRVQSSEPTQTLTRGDSGSLTGTSSFRGVCSTLPGALGKATCCLTAKPFFAISCFKEIRLCAVAALQTSSLLAGLGLPSGCRIAGTAALGNTGSQIPAGRQFQAEVPLMLALCHEITG